MTATATDTFGVFGTTAVIVVTEPTALGPARAIADAELAAVDLACSRFRPDSELSRINQARGKPMQISELLAALIAPTPTSPAQRRSSGARRRCPG